MSYLAELREQLRSIAGDVFLRDPYFEHINSINSNKDARIFLRRLVKCARLPPHFLNITSRLMAKIVGSPRKKIFIQWFQYNVPAPAEYRRVRLFLNEFIEINALETRAQFYALWNEETSQSSSEAPMEMLDTETMSEFRRRTNIMRVVHRAEGFPITNMPDALEILGYMLDAFSEQKRNDSDYSPSPSEDNYAIAKIGDDANDCHNFQQEISCDFESLGLLGELQCI